MGSEVDANADLAALLKATTPGPWFVAGARVKLDRQDTHAICQYDETLKRDMNIANVWYDPRTNAGHADAALIARAPDLAADKLRLTAQVADLTAANAALAADNARLAKRVDEAREALRAISDGSIPDQPATSAVSEEVYIRRHVAYLRSFARAWLAGGDA